MDFWAPFTIFGVMALGMMVFAIMAINQRDDGDNVLRAVRFFAYSHPDSGLTDTQRLELIKQALKEGKR